MLFTAEARGLDPQQLMGVLAAEFSRQSRNTAFGVEPLSPHILRKSKAKSSVRFVLDAYLETIDNKSEQNRRDSHVRQRVFLCCLVLRPLQPGCRQGARRKPRADGGPDLPRRGLVHQGDPVRERHPGLRKLSRQVRAMYVLYAHSQPHPGALDLWLVALGIFRWL